MPAGPTWGPALKQSIIGEARRLGFVLAGFTTPEPPPHLAVFDDWLMRGRHASMRYLADERSRARRADPRLVMPNCRSILVVAAPYSNPAMNPTILQEGDEQDARGRVAAYAWGDDYHVVLPKRLKAIVAFVEEQVGSPVSSRWYTDTGPVLERDFAQRAGLGWIGKNSCLINPRLGSYLLLGEILLDLDVEPDAPFVTDRCGTCTRCIAACPTDCILPDRTLDAGRCISYLTIEHKDEISSELRPRLGAWVFGCDVCQMVCPWNRFALAEGDAAFHARPGVPQPSLINDLLVAPEEFDRRFKGSPVRRAKRRGYRRNVAVALGNLREGAALPALTLATHDPDELIQKHAAWAIQHITAPEGPGA